MRLLQTFRVPAASLFYPCSRVLKNQIHGVLCPNPWCLGTTKMHRTIQRVALRYGDMRLPDTQENLTLVTSVAETKALPEEGAQGRHVVKSAFSPWTKGLTSREAEMVFLLRSFPRFPFIPALLPNRSPNGTRSRSDSSTESLPFETLNSEPCCLPLPTSLA
ncbi:hypothetical protein VTI74DRAFT_10566 [Chaetomium olivicolor]